MAVTRIKNNQITDLTVDAAAKLQDYSITSGKIANNLTYGSDLTISGNLIVNGTTTTIDTIDLVVEDPLILLAKNQTGSPTLDIGYIGKRGTSDNIAMVWNEANAEFVTAFTSSELTNTTITISSYANFHTANLTAQNANITGTANIGNVVIGNIVGDLTVSGNIRGANLLTTGLVSATGNVTGGNVNTAGVVSATGNVSGGNITTAGAVSATGNVAGGNVITTGLVQGATVSATGNLVGGNANITSAVNSATVSATGNIAGGNVTTAGTVSATGNVAGGNITTVGVVSATGNVSGGNVTTVGAVSATGNVNGGNLISEALVQGVTLSASGNIVAGNANISSAVNSATVSATGNIAGGNVNTAGTVSATGNVTGGNVLTGGLISSTGNVTGGNLNTAGVVSATGNISGGNVITTGLVQGATVSATGNLVGGNANITSAVNSATVSATGNIVGGNLSTAGTVSATGNVSGGNVTTAGVVSATGNVSGGNVTTAGVVSATGNITSLGKLEGATLEVNGDALVAGNLVVQGNLTYINVDDLRVEDPIIQLGGGPNGNVLVTNDGMDRGTFMAYYTDAVGNAFMGWDNSTGNMVIASNVSLANNVVTYNALGTLQAGNAYLESASVIGTISGGNLSTAGTVSATGNITGGNVNTAGAVSATGDISGGNLIAASLVQGTTVSASGNIVGGNANITSAVNSATVSATGNIAGGNLSTAGLVTATGNVTGGNLLTAGIVSATGNVSGGNVTTTGAVSATGNVNGGNLIAASLVQGTTVSATGNLVGGNANITSAVNSATVSATGNIAGGNLSTAGLITATGNITGGNVITAGIVQGATVSATGNLVGGNANITSAVNSATVSATGNITGGNVNTDGAVSATGNVTGGNINTAGVVSATGNITGGNLSGTNITGTTTSMTGNVTGGNLNTAGLVTATGNVTGGNLLTGGIVSAAGNVSGGNISTAGEANLGNIRISGDTITGTNGQVLVNSAQGVVNFIVSGDNQANLLYTDATTDTVMIGTGTPTANAALKIGTSNSMIIPVGNVSQRPPVGVTGMLRFNTTTDQLEYYDSDSWTSAGTTFTVITDNQYNGDDVTTTFTLSTSSTTAATIVSINGVMQIPTTAYSVSGTSLVFTEAPASTDVIDARCLTTTSTIIGIQNTSGNAVIEGSATAAQFDVTGNLVPTANVTYSLGSPTNYWKTLYVGGNSIYLGSLVIKDAGSNQIGFYQADGTTPATVAASSVDTTRIANGTSNLSVIASGGNIQANVGGATIVKVTSLGIENGQANGVGNIGTSSTYFNTVFAKATSAQYADLAEMYAADQVIEPGTVVCFGGTEEIIVCDQDACRRVAGVVSTNPSYLMNSALDSQYPTAVALQGRVPVKVTGSVRKGDMMVAATQGRARAELNPQIGAVIGKALEDFDGENGIIEVVVGRL